MQSPLLIRDHQPHFGVEYLHNKCATPRETDRQKADTVLPIFVISLSSSTSRQERCAAMLDKAGLEYSFWDAVDGRLLGADETAQVYDAKRNRTHFKRPLSGSEIGCYMSHLTLWAHIAGLEAPGALILEDDALIDPTLPGFLGALEGYDIDALYLKIDGVRGTPDPDSAQGEIAGHRLHLARKFAPRTTGYVLGRGAAKRLAAYQDRFFRPVDMDLKHYWEHQVPIYTVTPQLVREVETPSDLSTIEASRKNVKTTNFLIRGWKNLLYQVNYRWSCLISPPRGPAVLPKQDSH